ncbi:hypothetical protein EJB05_24333, partial [Eragrostis curvula]
ARGIAQKCLSSSVCEPTLPSPREHSRQKKAKVASSCSRAGTSHHHQNQLTGSPPPTSAPAISAAGRQAALDRQVAPPPPPSVSVLRHPTHHQHLASPQLINQLGSKQSNRGLLCSLPASSSPDPAPPPPRCTARRTPAMRWKLNNSAYKRVPSREAAMDYDLETPVKANDGGDSAPSWRRSLPHVCVATLTSFLFGYHSGVVNEPLESISTDLGFSGNTLAEGLVVSICLGGAFIGCLFSGSVADGIGRRRGFQLSALPMILGAAVSALTNSMEGMLFGRFLVGTGMGLGPPIASLYITEVSPPAVRGTYGSFVQIATCLGIIVSLLIGTPVKDIDRWWRVCFWVAAIPATLLALLMEFCAESPQWLYKCGRTSEAEMQFEKLLGPLHVKSAMAELSRTERGDDGESVKYSELFHGRHFNVVFIGTTLFALQQLSGINSVFYFSSTVFRSVGVPSNLANICMGVSNLSGSIVAMLLMDKLGRKVLLSGSFLAMAFSMGLQAIGANRHIGSASVYLSVGGILMFVLSFSLGAGPVPGLLLPEIFPNKIRAKAVALCMSVHWFFNFFVSLLFLRLLEQLGPQLLYTIFSSFCVIAAIFVRRNVVETKGKTLQEIEEFDTTLIG